MVGFSPTAPVTVTSASELDFTSIELVVEDDESVALLLELLQALRAAGASTSRSAAAPRPSRRAGRRNAE